MKPVTLEWIEKAEKDLTSARRELRLRTSPNYDLACFLAQQSVEKYLKARLQEASLRFDRTHDLVRLIDQLIPIEPLWSVYRKALTPLSTYAVVFRYPGHSATKQMARAAVDHAVTMRKVVREALSLNVGGQTRRTPSRSTRKKIRRKKKS